MFDYPMVQRLAFEQSMHELVEYIEENRRDYMAGIIKGFRTE